jgi:diaminohydroxyphosphoribosylaminopyrimidine deaminase/5-amino-6-(5-phosphoribosylamino)uracil reductase
MARFDGRDLADVLRWLASRGITSLLVEGGSELHAAFFEAQLVDRVQRVETPHVMGDGVPVAAGFAADRRPRSARVKHLGADTMVEWDVHGTD